MADERWRRVEDLFVAALDLPPAEREAFFERECGPDLELRREAESLVEADAADGSDIAMVVEDAAAELVNGESMAGARLGAYRIVEESGRGGMGTVYLAVRADEAFEKRVAIKLVKRGVDTDAVLARFRQERRILAGLDHPNITRLLDAGTSPDGRPYFVMEYVEGRPIHEYCRERHLSLHARCALFRKVCEAVSYAHRNLVIHRDLKPANILVTADGTPKLLDFGIARLLSVEPGQNTLGPGGNPSGALTPAYASPEQLRGEAVTTATDVYSLGAVLFEVLTGAGPAPGEQHASGRAVARPSVAAGNDALRRALAADLDNIVLRATHPEPERRYQSADHLSDDLLRYLTARPVLARPDTVAYRAGKFFRRHYLSVLAAAVLALGMMGGSVAVLWEARQAAIQERRAEQRLGQLVELANRTLFDVHGSIERLPGATEARRMIVRSTLDYLDRLSKEGGNDPRLLRALASAYMRVGQIEGDPDRPNLGDLRGSVDAYAKARKLLDPLIAANPGKPDLLLESAEVCLGSGKVLDASGRPDEATSILRQGVGLVDAVLRRDAGNVGARKLSSELHQSLLRILAYPDPEAARRGALEQLAVSTKLAADRPGDSDLLLNLAGTYSLVGLCANRMSRTAESLGYYRKAVELRERVFALHPDDVAVERDLMLSYGHVGDMLGSPFFANLGDAAGALENYRKAARIAEMMSTADPSNATARRDLAMATMRVGAVMASDREIPESLALLDKSAAILKALTAGGPQSSIYHRDLALVYEFKAQRLRQKRDYREALRYYRQSLKLVEGVLAQNPGDRPSRVQAIVDYGGMAGLLAVMRDRAGAVDFAGRAMAAAKAAASEPKATAPLKARWARSLGWAGSVYEALALSGDSPAQLASDRKLAAAYYRQAAAAWRRLNDTERGSYKNEVAAAERKVADSRKNGL